MKNMHDKPVPWIVPKLSKPLVDIFIKYGKKVTYKKDSIIIHEKEIMDFLFYIKSGIISQAVVNFSLNKPLAMNIFIPGRMMGYLNFFTGTNSPRRITALDRSEIIILDFDMMECIIDSDMELYKRLVNYCELCDRSELNGMIGLFSMSTEDRLRFLFTNILCAYGYSFDESMDNEWVKVPISIRRDDIIKIIYTSKITLDRLFANWVKSSFLMRDGRHYYIKPANLREIYKWVTAI